MFLSIQIESKSTINIAKCLLIFVSNMFQIKVTLMVKHSNEGENQIKMWQYNIKQIH